MSKAANKSICLETLAKPQYIVKWLRVGVLW